jgi:phosphoribosylamine-glycine ligase
MKRYIAVIGGGIDSVLVINKINQLGYSSIVVDRNPKAPGMFYADEKITLSTHEAQPIISRLEEYDDLVAAVVTRSSGVPVMVTAEVADALGLPGVGKDAARILTDKGLFKSFCKRNNIPFVEGFIITDEIDTNKIRNIIPCVIKPALEYSGKAGVNLLIDKTKPVEPPIEAARQNAVGGTVLVEKYVPGKEMSLIAVVYNGIVYPFIFVSESHGFNEKGKLVTGEIKAFKPKEELRKELLDIAQKIVTSAMVRCSPLFISYRVTDKGKAYPFEINLSFAGDWVMEKVMPKDLDFIGEFLNACIMKIKPKVKA